MIVHLLSTGDELISGDIADTNSAWLCQELINMGLRVEKIHGVADDTELIADTIRQISSRAGLCIVTGGLGPTGDDLTAFACSLAAGVGMQLNEEALVSMKAYFVQKGYNMVPENEKQALLPVGAEPVINNYGTAPGFHIVIGSCLFIFMPGVPREMKQMFGEKIKPLISLKCKKELAPVFVEKMTVFGLGESTAGAVLKDFYELFPGIRLSFRVIFPLIRLKLVQDTTGDNAKAEEILKARQWVMEKLGNKIISDKGFTMAEEVGRLLSLKNKSLALAESCTGGRIANMITDMAGSSDYFLFSGVTYSNEAKMSVLNVQERTLVENGAVSEPVALEMAEGARKKSNADYAISTTGIAGPGGGSPEKPLGMVCIGLSSPSSSFARTYKFHFNDREMNKQIFSITALNLLRRELLKLKGVKSAHGSFTNL